MSILVLASLTACRTASPGGSATGDGAGAAVAAPSAPAPAPRVRKAFPTPAELPLPLRIWWAWDDPARPKHVLAWRVFNLREAASASTLYLSTTAKSCKVWINGKEIEVPKTGTPSWWKFQRMEGPALGTGDNLIVVHCESSDLPQPYLMAMLDCRLSGGTFRVITDSHWSMGREMEMTPDLKLAEFECDEVKTKRRIWAFDGAWAEPWGMPTGGPEDLARMNRGTHSIEEQTLSAVVRTEAGLGAWTKAEGGGPLVARPFYRTAPDDPPIGWGGVRNMYHLIREDLFKRHGEWLDEHEARCPRLVYDLGEETFGRLKLRNAGTKKCWVVIGLGESVGELDRYNRRHIELYPIPPGETVTTKMSGCRYAKVIVLAGEDGEEVRLDPPVFQHVLYNIDRTGEFSCSDAKLTRAFDVAAHTVHLCMQTEIWDAPRRDLLPWMGDLHMAGLSSYHAFGGEEPRRAEPVRRTLRALRELGPDPLEPIAKSPAAGLRSLWRADKDQEINGVASYTIWWVIALHDYWRYTGDLTLVRDLAPGLPGVLRRITARVNKEGGWESPSKDWGSNYVDWANLRFEASSAAIHVMSGRALEGGAELLRAAGRDTEAAEFEPVAAAMRRFFHEKMVDPQTGTALSPYGDPKKPLEGEARENALAMHHQNAVALEYGWLEGDAARKAFANSVAKPMKIHHTPWWRYHDLEAASAVGETAWGLGMMREIWGGMLDLGATSFWEAFDPVYKTVPDPHAATLTTESIFGYGGYRTSLCHGWSSGPAVWLHTGVLGVRPLADGYGRFRFAPELGDLAWAKGTVPTPRGPIRVRLAKKGGEVLGWIEVPAGAAGETAIPGLDLKGPCQRTFRVGR